MTRNRDPPLGAAAWFHYSFFGDAYAEASAPRRDVGRRVAGKSAQRGNAIGRLSRARTSRETSLGAFGEPKSLRSAAFATTIKHAQMTIAKREWSHRPIIRRPTSSITLDCGLRASLACGSCTSRFPADGSIAPVYRAKKPLPPKTTVRLKQHSAAAPCPRCHTQYKKRASIIIVSGSEVTGKASGAPKPPLTLVRVLAGVPANVFDVACPQ